MLLYIIYKDINEKENQKYIYTTKDLENEYESEVNEINNDLKQELESGGESDLESEHTSDLYESSDNSNESADDIKSFDNSADLLDVKNEEKIDIIKKSIIVLNRSQLLQIKIDIYYKKIFIKLYNKGRIAFNYKFYKQYWGDKHKKCLIAVLYNFLNNEFFKFIKINYKIMKNAKITENSEKFIIFYKGICSYKAQFVFIGNSHQIYNQLTRGINVLLKNIDFMFAYNNKIKKIYYYGGLSLMDKLNNDLYSSEIFHRREKYIPILENNFINDDQNEYPIDLTILLNKLNESKFFINELRLKFIQVYFNKLFKNFNKFKKIEQKIKDIDIMIKALASGNKKNLRILNKLNKLKKGMKELNNQKIAITNIINCNMILISYIKNIDHCHIEYFYDTRYRIYPKEFILNYQQNKILRNILTTKKYENEEIIDIYITFIRKIKNNVFWESISENLFNFKKLNKKNINKLIEIANNFEIKEPMDLNLNKIDYQRNELYINIWYQTLYNYIYYLGSYKLKITIKNKDDEIFENGIDLYEKIIINEFNEEEIFKLNLNPYETINIINLKEDLKDFLFKKNFSNSIYFVDATTSGLQMITILFQKYDNRLLEKIAFKNSKSALDIYSECVENYKIIIKEIRDNNNEFTFETEFGIKTIKLTKKNKEKLEKAQRLEFKIVTIPYMYGQKEKFCFNNINKKMLENDFWTELNKKEKKLFIKLAYKSIQETFKIYGIEIINFINIFKKIYIETGGNINKNYYNLPYETSISIEHFKYLQLKEKEASVAEVIKSLTNRLNYLLTNPKENTEKIMLLGKRIERLEKKKENWKKMIDDLKEVNKNHIFISKININYFNYILNNNRLEHRIIGKIRTNITIPNYKIISTEEMLRTIFVNYIHLNDASVLHFLNLMLDVEILNIHDSFGSNMQFVPLLIITYKLAIASFMEKYSKENPFLIYAEKLKNDNEVKDLYNEVSKNCEEWVYNEKNLNKYKNIFESEKIIR